MRNFKVGDKVRVVKLTDLDRHDPKSIRELKRYVGKKGTIAKVLDGVDPPAQTGESPEDPLYHVALQVAPLPGKRRPSTVLDGFWDEELEAIHG